MAAHLIGSRFSPVIGRMLDHLGVSRSLAIEGGYFAGAFLFAAFAAWGAASGRFGDGPLGAVLVFLAYILVMLTDHFNTVHTVMMKQLSLRPEDVMGNLSLGLSVDHVLAVTVSWRLRGDLEGMGATVCVLTGSPPAARCIWLWPDTWRGRGS